MKIIAFIRYKISLYNELAKASVTGLVITTTAAGFYIASPNAINWWLMFKTVFGTFLVAGGASALNQFAEVKYDALMKRTAKRPLPTGRISRREVAIFGTSIAIAGIFILAIGVNLLTGALAFATIAFYLFLYTPLKRKTTLATLVGAVPGALPPVGGWTAVRGEINIEAGILFAILFLWQIPHFLAIAWLYKEDYKRGGYHVLPIYDPLGDSTSRFILSNTVSLIAISLMPTLLGLTGGIYFWGAMVLGASFFYAGIQVALERSQKTARTLLFASIIYLPGLLFLMGIDAQ